MTKFAVLVADWSDFKTTTGDRLDKLEAAVEALATEVRHTAVEARKAALDNDRRFAEILAAIRTLQQPAITIPTPTLVPPTLPTPPPSPIAPKPAPAPEATTTPLPLISRSPPLPKHPPLPAIFPPPPSFLGPTTTTPLAFAVGRLHALV